LGRVDRGGLKGAILHLLFRGLARPTVESRARHFATSALQGRMLREAVATLQGHLASGDHVVVLSASPDVYVRLLAAGLGGHEAPCSVIRWDGDRLDGRLTGCNRRDAETSRVLDALRAAHPGLPVIAYGNSGPDLIHMRRC